MPVLTRYYELFRPNYLKYFNSLGNKPASPTIFIFDNELSNKDKPLKSFFNYVYGSGNEVENKKSQKLDQLKDKLSLEVEENLFLVTHKLMSESNECEMEDLFDKDTLSHEIGGKIFSKNGDNNKHYGKEIFSKYVLENYENINFDNFRSLLDNLNEIILNFKK